MSPSSASSSSRSSSPTSSLYSVPLTACSPPSHTNMTTTINTTSTRASVPMGPVPGTAPPIASLPSLAHSLSAFPTMTVVANDMVHYGTLGRTKGASEAKLTSALRRTKQRQDAAPGAMVSASTTSGAAHAACRPTPEDDDPVLLIVPKRSKAKRSS
ncbi:hypothetical protein BD414DRAFT_578366 [Trametes punicea]|nr:hypothetical protein BD414DRAFT_578366 [Trametes punicea]